jgi:ABC-type transport system involved in cytochrome c biogenesis permease component
MFCITQDPSPGSVKLCMLHPVQHTHILQVRICRQTLTTHTTTCMIEQLSVILVKYSLTLPGDGSRVIQNMLE